MSNLGKVFQGVAPKIIDGRVYVDLDALIDPLFKHLETASQMALDAQDPALGLMVLGQTHLVQALEDVLSELQKAAGQIDQGASVSPSDGHTEPQ